LRIINERAGSKFTDNSPQTKPQGSRDGNLDVIKRRDKTEDIFKEKGCGKVISSDEGTCNYCGEFIKCEECREKGEGQ